MKIIDGFESLLEAERTKIAHRHSLAIFTPQTWVSQGNLAHLQFLEPPGFSGDFVSRVSA